MELVIRTPQLCAALLRPMVPLVCMSMSLVKLLGTKKKGLHLNNHAVRPVCRARVKLSSGAMGGEEEGIVVARRVSRSGAATCSSQRIHETCCK